MALGNLIKYRRHEKNLTQKQLADKAGISLMSVQRYERNERKPTVEILEKIAAAFGISVANLMGITDIGVPPNETGLLESVFKKIPLDKLLREKSDAEIKQEMFIPISDIAKISKISLEKTFTPKIVEPTTEDTSSETPIMSDGEFDGIIVTYKDQQFKISADEYYKITDRIIENVATNILAAQIYKK